MLKTLRLHLSINHDQKNYLEQKQKDLLLKLEDSQAKFISLQRSFVELEDEYSKQSQQLSTLLVETAFLKQTLEVQRSEYESKQKEIDDSLINLRSENKVLLEKLKNTKELEDHVSELSDLNKRLSLELSELSEQRAKERDVLKATQEHLVRSIRQKEELKNQLDGNAVDRKSSETECEKLRQRIGDLENMKNDLQQCRIDLFQSEKHVGELRHQLHQLLEERTAGIHIADTTLNALQFDLTESRQALSDSERRNQSLERETADFAQENAKLRRLLQEKNLALMELAKGIYHLFGLHC